MIKWSRGGASGSAKIEQSGDPENSRRKPESLAVELTRAFQLTSAGPTAPLPLTFIDQANSIRTGGGAVMNIPYLADKIINLNH